MAAHNDLGKKGEDLATQFLKDKGYGILERNWKFNGWEIDIIARNETEIVFVEVKTRSDDYFLNPEDAVDFNRRCRLTSAANAYLRYYKIDLDARFDIIAIVWNENRCDIKHIEDAFIATRRNKYYRR